MKYKKFINYENEYTEAFWNSNRLLKLYIMMMK